MAVGGAPIVSFMDRHTMEFDNYLVDELYNWKKSDFIMPWVRERAAKNLELSKDPDNAIPTNHAIIMKQEFRNLSTHQSKELSGTRVQVMNIMLICMHIILSI